MRCIVYNCHSKRNNVSSFRFPANAKKRRAWLKAIKNGLKLDSWDPEISHNSRICSAHFVEGWHSDDRDDVNYRPTIFNCPDELVEKKKGHVDSKTVAQFNMDFQSTPYQESDPARTDQEVMIAEDTDINTGSCTAAMETGEIGAGAEVKITETTSHDAEADQDPVAPVIKVENVSSSCYNCVTPQSPQMTGPYVCGSCRYQYDTVCDLHAHIQSHGLGGSYHYDHKSRTAFPKYDSVCTGTQATPKFDVVCNGKKISGDGLTVYKLTTKAASKTSKFTRPLLQPTKCRPELESTVNSAAITTESVSQRPELTRPLLKPTKCCLDSESIVNPAYVTAETVSKRPEFTGSLHKPIKGSPDSENTVKSAAVNTEVVSKRPVLTRSLLQESKSTQFCSDSKSNGQSNAQASLQTSLGISLSIDTVMSAAVTTKSLSKLPEFTRSLLKPTKCRSELESTVKSAAVTTQTASQRPELTRPLFQSTKCNPDSESHVNSADVMAETVSKRPEFTRSLYKPAKGSPDSESTVNSAAVNTEAVNKKHELTRSVLQQSKSTQFGSDSISNEQSNSHDSLKTSLGISLSIDTVNSAAVTTKTLSKMPEFTRSLLKPTVRGLDSEGKGQGDLQTSRTASSNTDNTSAIVTDQTTLKTSCKELSQEDQTHELAQRKKIIKSVSGNTNEVKPIASGKEISSSSDTGSLKFTCVKCKLVFSSEEYLQNHFRKHKGILLCDCCDESFESVAELQEHIEAADQKAVEILHCLICGMVVTGMRGVKAHLCVSIEAEQTKVVQKQSKDCGKSDKEKKQKTSSTDSSTSDGKESSSSLRNPKVVLQKGEMKMQCETCRALFENECFLTSHSVVHKYVHRCRKCNLCFKMESDRDLHHADCLNPFTKWKI